MKEFEDLRKIITKQGAEERLKIVQDELDKVNEMMQRNYEKI